MGRDGHIIAFGIEPRQHRLVLSSLESFGLRVSVAGTVPDLVRMRRPRDLVLLDVDAAREIGLNEIALALGGAAVVLASGHRNDPSAARLEALLSPRATLLKPLDLLELPHILQSHLPEALLPEDEATEEIPHPDIPLDDASGTRDLAARNLALLARVWARSSTGTLVVRSPREEQVLCVRGGALEDPKQFVALEPCLVGSMPLHFQASPDSSGARAPDWAGLAGILYRAAHLHVRQYPQPLAPGLALMTAGNSMVWSALPLSSGLRKALAAARPDLSLSDLAGKLDLSVQALETELAILAVLGFARFSVPTEEPEALPPTLEIEDEEEADEPSSTRRPVPEAYRSERFGTLPTRSETETETETETKTETEVPPRPERPETPPSVRKRGGVATASRTLRSNHGAEELAALQRRLLAERDRLEGAGPFVVLGVPASSQPELVRQASERLQARYRSLAEREDLDEQGKACAKDLEAFVKKAEANALRMATAAAPSIDLLQVGRSAITVGDWIRADKALTRANSERVSDPNVLVNLGWARLHNPTRDHVQQRAEAREFLLLAEQLAPNDAEVLRYVTRFLLLEKEYERAAARASRLAKVLPNDEEAVALATECQARQRASIT